MSCTTPPAVVFGSQSCRRIILFGNHGFEPESLDPQSYRPAGGPDHEALYEGLVEYHPITMEPIPGIAESWEVGPDGTEYLFHLRKNAKFRTGPDNRNDFVYSFRRALSPDLASRNANLGYYLKYSGI